MKHSLLLLACLNWMFCLVVPVWAIEVADAVITTAVVEREPVDKVEVFTLENSRAYCFSRIVGADYPTTVSHPWFLDEKLMSRIELPVKSPDWRTWSLNTFGEVPREDGGSRSGLRGKSCWKR